MAALHELSVSEAARLIRDGALSSFDLVEALLARIASADPKIGAYLSVDAEDARRQARAADAARAQGDCRSLLGVPVGIKDVLNVQGQPCTCGSKILKGYTCPYDATAVARLREQGAVILGRLNMDEFAMGSSTENSAYTVTHNPHDLERVPGGTSGGSAAAVAAHECILALGTDTGGSVRQPASFCGVVGIKPTYGRVSRYGLVAYGSSLDQVGVLAKDVRDTALALQVIAGHDAKDSTCLDVEVPDYHAALSAGIKPRIGVPSEYFAEGLDGEVRDSVQNAIELLRQDGHEVVPIHLPHTEYAVPVYYIIACAEASANLARYDGVRYGFRAKECNDVKDLFVKSRTEGFGAEVRRRIILGTYVLSTGYYDAYYLKAQKVRTLMRRDFQSAFEQCDIIMHPVAPTPAYKIGEHTDDPLAMYLGDIYSVTANLVGIPGINVPCGWTKNKLPIGVQLSTKPLGEPALLTAAQRLETLLNDTKAWAIPGVA